MPDTTHLNRRWIRGGMIWVSGWLLVYAILIAGLWVLYSGWIPGADRLLGGRHIHPFSHYGKHFTVLFIRAGVGVSLLILLGYGWMSWVRLVGGWRRFLPRFVFLLAFTALLSELLLRMAFSMPGGILKPLQDASLLADSFSDDAYWVLHARVSAQDTRDHVHPVLGWGQSKITNDNPLALKESVRNALTNAGPAVFFFGDSFVHGMPFNQKTLPEMVSERSLAHNVINLGVRGYGVDQMYLLARELGRPAPGGEVWVGVLTWDLDRVYLNFMYGQKPRYRIHNDQLTLTNVPIMQSDREYVQSFKMPFHSWLFQALRRQWQIRQGLEKGGPVMEEKAAINKAIFKEWVTWCREADIPLRVVLFHTRQDLNSESWRNRTVKNICAEYEIPLFDTADVLVPQLKKNGTWGEEFYEQGDFHHTDLANELIAEWLAEHWINAQTEDARQEAVGQ